MSDTRLENIESILASQGEQISDLSDMVNAQWKEIDRLKMLLSKAGEKIQSLEDNIDVPEANTPPPHY